MNQSEPAPTQSRSYQYEFVPRTEVREPITGREETYCPYEAPSLISRTENEEVEAHQAEVDQMFDTLIEEYLPSDTPKTAKEHVRQGMFAADALVNIENKKGYENRLMLLPEWELSGEQLKAHQLVLMGKAAMGAIADDMDVVQRSSAELAMLRTVNGYRAEYEPQLDAALNSLVDEPSEQDDEPLKIRIIGFDHSFYRGQDPNAMTVEFKYHHGASGNGAVIKSRTSLAVRLDQPSGFDQGIRNAICQASRSGRNHAEQLFRVRPVLLEIARVGIQHPNVIASTRRVYRYNPKVERELAARQGRKALDFDSTKIYRANF